MGNMKIKILTITSLSNSFLLYIAIHPFFNHTSKLSSKKYIMAGASSSKTPDMTEALREPALEIRKSTMEDEVFHEILCYWEELQGLKLLYDSGEATTPSLVAKLRRVRNHLHIAEWVDIFTDGHIYQLMLRKETKILKRIAGSDSFLKNSTGPLAAWLKIWIIVVEEEYHDVIRANVYG